MKIAITSKGTTLDAEVDPRFRKAAYILIVDTTNLSVEALDNSQNNALKGKGIQTAAMVNDIGATILLTGFCGPNAFKTLKVSGIKVANVSGTVREAVNKFNEGALSYADEYTMAPPRMKGKI
ncbi:MAG: NifB/NifX family molybdenum-iron cluster-binding protein [Spirochaetales bacterium]|jgi:predicted Fe-Mo cluster-binding NifX family protein|nr:NifB/NifX family molybdenum-iron cluster-binding protein [Spirochaetales bacterium]